MKIQNYGVEDIKTLEGIEAIRLRPGMYIGSVEQEGIQHIALEIISNVVDEYLNGHCNLCSIIIEEDGTIIISDNGRGVPFGKAPDGSETLVNVYTKLHTGAKFDSSGQSGYNTSGGMNGVGAKATNALSEYFEVVSYRDAKKATAQFKKGQLINYTEIGVRGLASGTTIKFKPDKEIFKSGNIIDIHKLEERIQELAYLSPGLVFELQSHNKEKRIFMARNGIVDYLTDLHKNKETITSIFSTSLSEDRVGIDVVMQYNQGYGEIYKLYTNAIPNSGGTHLTGFKAAMTTSINNYARANKLLKDKDENIIGDDLREGLTAIISFRMPDPVFSGQTKDVLSSSEARTIVHRLISTELTAWLNTHPKDAQQIINKALAARKAREAAKKARDNARNSESKAKGLKAKMQLSDKFIDCSNKNPSQRNLLLVEGLSAGSSAIEARNVKTDCIYMLRGKILSTLKTTKDKIFANQELSDIIRVIGAGFDKEFDINKMQFDKIVITSDQDSDGMNIELLLITFFYTYMRPLVEAGKLYRAVTPLYIVKRKGKEDLYFYTDEELQTWETTNKATFELVRCKGLGEIDPKDLKAVCFEQERFKRITVSDAKETEKLLETLMGTNVNPRKQYIYDNATRLGFNFQ